MPDDPTEEHLRAREANELDTAEHAVLEAAERAARRRADKAGYLADKLAEQEAADDERTR